MAITVLLGPPQKNMLAFRLGRFCNGQHMTIAAAHDSMILDLSHSGPVGEGVCQIWDIYPLVI